MLAAGHFSSHFLPLGRAPPLGRRHKGRVLAKVDEGRQPLEAEAVDEASRPDRTNTSHRSAASPRIRRVIGAVLGTHTTVRTSLSPNVAKMRSITGRNARALGPIGKHDEREVEDRRPVVERPRHAR